MNEKIFEMLNDAEINLDEYEAELLSSEEAEKIEISVLKGIRKMKRKKSERSRKRAVKIAGTAVAACMTICVAAAAADQVRAKNMLGGAFVNLISSLDGNHEETLDIQEKYKNIGEKAISVEEMGGNNPQGGILETSDAGVTIAAKDIYCDGYTIFYTLEMKVDDENLKAADFVTGSCQEEGAEGEERLAKVLLNGERYEEVVENRTGWVKGTDGSYTAINSIDLWYLTCHDGKQYQNGETLSVSYEVNRIWGFQEGVYEEAGEDGLESTFYKPVVEKEGKWKLEIPVTVDTSSNVVTKYGDKEENGVKLVSVTKAKAVLGIVVELPDLRKEPYFDPYNDPDIAITGAGGEELQWLGNYREKRADGGSTCRIIVLDKGDDTLKLEVVNKNNGGSTIAQIEFQINREQDEEGADDLILPEEKARENLDAGSREHTDKEMEETHAVELASEWMEFFAGFKPEGRNARVINWQNGNGVHYCDVQYVTEKKGQETNVNYAITLNALTGELIGYEDWTKPGVSDEEWLEKNYSCDMADEAELESIYSVYRQKAESFLRNEMQMDCEMKSVNVMLGSSGRIDGVRPIVCTETRLDNGITVKISFDQIDQSLNEYRVE